MTCFKYYCHLKNCILSVYVTLFLVISTVDKKPAVEVNSDVMSSTKSRESGSERSLNRRLGIRDLPMPPMPSDADDDVDEDEADAITEQDLQKKEDDLCDIVKSFVRSTYMSTSPAESLQQLHQQYVLMTIWFCLFVNCGNVYINLQFICYLDNCMKH